jgi:hypothetical protein
MMQLKDDLLKVTKALPAGAASTTSDAIDTGKGSRDDHAAHAELLLTYPDLTLVQLPNTKTMTYQILGSDNADLSSPSITATLVTQTGLTGTDPCPGGTVRYRPPSNGPRYWGAKATGVATADGSGSSMTLQMVF